MHKLCYRPGLDTPPPELPNITLLKAPSLKFHYYSTPENICTKLDKNIQDKSFICAASAPSNNAYL